MLDAGEIVEFDAPYRLLQDKSGTLRKLVNQTGVEEASRLELQAKNAMKENDDHVEDEYAVDEYNSSKETQLSENGMGNNNVEIRITCDGDADVLDDQPKETQHLLT